MNTHAEQTVFKVCVAYGNGSSGFATAAPTDKPLQCENYYNTDGRNLVSGQVFIPENPPPATLASTLVAHCIFHRVDLTEPEYNEGTRFLNCQIDNCSVPADIMMFMTGSVLSNCYTTSEAKLPERDYLFF